MRITPKESLGPMHSVVPTLLANDASSIIWGIGPIILGLIAVVVVGWFVVVHVRSWMKASGESGEAFTLDDLRRMHRAGEISDAEFQRAREAMIGAIRSKGTKEPPPRNPDLDVLRQRHQAAAQRTMNPEPAPTPPSRAIRTSPPATPSATSASASSVQRPSLLRPEIGRSSPQVQAQVGQSQAGQAQAGPAQVGKAQVSPDTQLRQAEALKTPHQPHDSSSQPDTTQQPPASRRDAVVRRPTILGDARFLREGSGKDPEDPSESAAQ